LGTQRLASPPRTKRHSNPFFLPLIVIGGLMGVLAGYGLLAMIRDHGFNLKPRVESADAKPTTQESVAVLNTNPTPSPIDHASKPQPYDVATSQAEINQSAQPTIDANERVITQPTKRRGRPAILASVATLKIATDGSAPHSSLPPPADLAAPPLPPPNEPSHDRSLAASPDAAPSLPPPSSPTEQTSRNDSKASAAPAIVSLTLKQDVIRVIALPEDVTADSLLCDIGFSPELTGRQLPTGTYDIVAERLGKRGEYSQELPLNMNGAGAAIEIKIRQQNKAAICENRPKFSLPMSGIKQLTIASGSILQKSLNRTLNNTVIAEQELPGMRSNLDDLKLKLADAVEHTNDTGSNISETGSLRIQWRARVQQLQYAIKKANNNIARDEQLIANKHALETDITDLNQISQYAEKIASNASISVRFYSGDVTIPATVK
jgi:hypothetical protein